MVKVNDLNPRGRDTLALLIQKAENTKTVPHGVKVAKPEEATVYRDFDGSEYRWDGAAIADYNSRIATAKAEIDAAKARLDQAEADITDANSRIQAASGDLSAQIDQINANTAKVDQARTDLNAMSGKLDATQADLSSLDVSVNDALTKADQAAANAGEAMNSARAAQDTANRASALAQEVQATADNARSTAEAAEAKAREAAGLAGSKGKTFYGSTAPTGGTSADLWIKSPGNTPHIWDNAAAKWVPVTDKAATDAATAASKAQQDATKALSDAAAAASTAQQAQIAAGNAQKSADGKTTVIYSTTTPPSPGVKVGDTHYQVNTSGSVIAWWRWDGSKWAPQTLNGATMDNLDAGKITAGYLDVAKRIQAGSIFADKLTIGIGDNIIPNGSGQAINGWENFEYSTTPVNGASGSFKLKGKNAQTSAKFSITPGVPFRCSCDVNSDNGTSNTYIETVFFNAQGAIVTPRSFIASNVIPAKGVWTRYTATITPPASAVQCAIKVFAQDLASTAVATDYQHFTNFSMREMKDGSLIVNGSITGDKVNAQSVAASVGQFVQVKAQNVEVTGDFAARVVNAMSTVTKNLVVTDEAILQHTTLLGTTVADELNVRKLLRGRDAILTGTVDVAQLNVTGEMAASIVNVMDLTAKKAVVTDEAIMNRVTVIQDIVTPQLVADKINSALVTGKVIQTSSAANTGVKIDSNGYKAYDSNGVLAVDLNGKNNLLIGNLKTSAAGGAGVKVTQTDTVAAIDFYPASRSSITPDNHGAVWWDGNSRGSEQGLIMAATRNAGVANTDPGILLQPGPGTVGIQGRIAGDSPALKSGIVLGDSIGANQWWTVDVTFPTPLTFDPAVLISPVTETGAECSIGIKNATRTGFSAIVKNQSGRTTGNAWIKWVAISL